MNIKKLNSYSKKTIKKQLLASCRSKKWAQLLANDFPFKTVESLVQRAEDIWYDLCEVEDWLEAFSHHPQIGDVESLSKKFAGQEQAGIKKASKATLKKLVKLNKAYLEKHGFIFLVAASGKSANELLDLLEHRLKNTTEEELVIAIGEQQKITIIRFKQLLDTADWSGVKNSQLTTHVLDTGSGLPAENLSISLQKLFEGKWQTFTQGITNADGRIVDLLPPGAVLEKGHYNMIFETGEYFKSKKVENFHPIVEIQFKVSDDSHYHIPLLLSPFGYTTYRGS